jgi:CRP-like cAMP-binding protein
MLTFPKRQIIFSQGNEADAVFYFQEGKAKFSVVSQQGKEAIVAILERAAFFGESCLATFASKRTWWINSLTLARRGRHGCCC